MSTDGTGRQSPLSAFFATAAGDPADAVVISERPFLGHLNLRGDPGDGGFTSAAAGVLGFALPTEPNTTAGKGGLLALWLGPDEPSSRPRTFRRSELSRSRAPVAPTPRSPEPAVRPLIRPGAAQGPEKCVPMLMLASARGICRLDGALAFASYSSADGARWRS